MRIDAHQHFWRYNQPEYGWMGENMSRLKRDFLPAHLAAVFKTVNIDGSVAVQARQSLEETRWLLELSEENTIIKGVVGWVDLSSDKLEQQLDQFAPSPKLVGVRHVVHDEPDDRFILGESFMRGVEKLAAYSLTFDILIFARHLPAAIEFVGAFPNHKFVVDHIAKPFIKDGILEPWKQHMIKLASFPNVMCKLSGMVTEADWKNWCVKDFEPYLDTVFTAFGPDRVMFGSDWPVCTVAATYRQVMELVGKWLEKKNATPRVKENFWGGNAAKFYRLKV